MFFRFERKGEIKQALHCYREALADNPSSEPAKSRASILTAVLEKKVCRVITGHVTLFCFLISSFYTQIWPLSLSLSSSEMPSNFMISFFT